MEITSTSNQHVKKWISLQQKKYREKYQLFLIEGQHLLTEALKMGIVESVIIRKNSDIKVNFDQVFYVDDKLIKKISTNVSLVDVIAICRYIENKQNKSDKVIVLDNVQDPSNVGAIIRTAVAFGYPSIFLSHNSVDIYNDKLIRATQGALFKINIVSGDVVNKIMTLKEAGYTIIATTLQDAKSLQSVKQEGPLAIIFGNEGSGVSQQLLDLADMKVKIEINNFESLNVAVAAGIVLYHFIDK